MDTVTASEDPTRRVFISYSTADRTRVDGLERLLVLFGHEVFLDFKSIRLGSGWKDEIKSALDQTDITLVYWTRSASASVWVRNEYEYFLARCPQRPLVPILGDETPLAEPLKERQTMTFVPVINELLELTRTMQAEGRKSADVQAAIRKRLEEAGIQLEDSDLKKAFRFFGVAGWLAWLPAPLVFFDWAWRSVFEAATQLSHAQVALMVTSTAAAAAITAKAVNDPVTTPVNKDPMAIPALIDVDGKHRLAKVGTSDARPERKTAARKVENENPPQTQGEREETTTPRAVAPQVGVAPVVDALSPEEMGEDGKNLAAAANGGTVVDPPAQYDGNWNAGNIIDGTLDGGYAAPTNLPISFVLGFKDQQVANISKVAIFPFTNEESHNWVRSIEIEVSEQFPFTGFRAIQTIPVSPFGKNEYVLPEPLRARFVRLNLLENGGGSWIELGEVRIHGELADDQPPQPLLENVALQENGGKILEFTSASSGYPAAELINGASRGYWSSTSTETQTIVFELGSPTNVSYVCVNPYSPTNSISNWVRSVEVSITNKATATDFESVGQLEIGSIGRDYALELRTPTPARFVKIVCTKNGGGSSISMGEVKVFGKPSSDR